MPLTSFSVAHGSDNADGIIIHAYDGRELVLAFVTRTALSDYFGWPWSLPDEKMPSSRERNLVVDRNLDTFAPIVQDKYRRGEFEFYKPHGVLLKKIQITSADLPREHIELTDAVIQTNRLALKASYGNNM